MQRYGKQISCISFDSYIKPQRDGVCTSTIPVVYLLIPTSNHNTLCQRSKRQQLYIFWFLHQTTTLENSCFKVVGCISFDSYIKPQHDINRFTPIKGCISFDSYIKPQLLVDGDGKVFSCISFDSYIKPQHRCYTMSVRIVVYLLIPTSNHNFSWGSAQLWCVVYLLIPTSNHNFIFLFTILMALYIFWFLHQTTTAKSRFWR